jgi:hypothetical protein
LNLDEIMDLERTLAHTTARMPFSPHLTIYYSQRKFGSNGELFLTERYIGFKGRTADFKIKVIILSLVLFIVAFSQLLLAFMVNDEDILSYLLESPNNVLYFITLGSLAILLVFSFKRERELSKGFVWPRDSVDITISGRSLLMLDKEGLTRIDFDDEENEILRILWDNIAEFQISDLSGLDYHEKMVVLEKRYKEGKLSKELYEELKKRLPYI